VLKCQMNPLFALKGCSPNQIFCMFSAGFKIMLDVFGACSPTREECVKMLKVRVFYASAV
jgi:hypothetical protein